MLRHYALLSSDNMVIATMLMDDQKRGEVPAHKPHVEIGNTKVELGWIFNPDNNSFSERPPKRTTIGQTEPMEVSDEINTQPISEPEKRKPFFSRWKK